MGSIITRGARSNRRFYLQFRAGTRPDGRPLLVMRVAKGARSKGDAKKELARIETAIARGEPWESGSKLVVRDVPTLLKEWSATLRNRAAKADQDIIARDLVPAFKGVTVEQLSVGVIMRWLDTMASGTLSGQSRLHRFGFLSRFCSWCVERELMDANPCRSVPRGKRPRASSSLKGVPYLEADAKVPEFIEKLEQASYGLGLMFYVGRFTGMREGEVAGLRMSDLDWMEDGIIRVRYSYDGPLKEDRALSGKSKKVPAPADAVDVLKLHLARRKLQGAKAEDLVFIYDRAKGRKGRWATWPGYHPHTIQQEFRAVADGLGLHDLDWYRATRHTFATKALMAGASLDEVSAALGHSSPVVTKKHYDHLVRKTFSAVLRQGLAK